MTRTLWRKYAGSIVLALTLALLGCSGDEEPNLTGTWTGTIQDSVAGPGTILLTIAQSGTQLTGTWQTTFGDPANNNGGSLSGTVGGGTSIALVLTASRSQACSYTVAATRDEDNDKHFTGTYASFNCALAQSGTIDVRR